MSSDYDDDWDEAAEAELIALESSLTTTSTPRPPRPPPKYLEINSSESSTNAIASTSKLPSIVIEDNLEKALNELDGNDDVNVVNSTETRSLWERFRKRKGGNLSVSDLVGPSWCEVQHTYRLSSKAYLRPEERPTSISGKNGVSIPIDLSRTISREKILDKGKAIHKVIEVEVMGVLEEIPVEVTTAEEKWALRILNMVIGLETLLTTGRTRELSVHGFVGDDILVYGVIDEVYRQDMTPAITASSSTSFTSKLPILEDPSQKKLETFFPSISSPTKSTSEPPKDVKRWANIISDTKTRNTPSLPRRGDSKSARLQLMLYHQFLTSLLATSPNSSSSSVSMSQALPQALPHSFSWTILYSKLNLDPLLPLSPTFLTSIQPIIAGSTLESRITRNVSTLEQYVEVLQSYGPRLSSGTKAPFENRLEISYRLRNTVTRYNSKQRYKKNRKLPEDEELAKALEESLKSINEVGSSSNVGFNGGNGEDEEQLALALALSLSEVEVAFRQEFGKERTQFLEEILVQEVESEVLPLLADPTSLLDLPINQINEIDENDFNLPSPPSLTSFELDFEENSQICTISAPAIPLNKRRKTSPSEFQENLVERTPKRLRNQDVDPSNLDRSPPLVPTTTSSTQPSDSISSIDSITPVLEILAEGALIGVEKFAFNSKLLQTHVDDMIQYWMGLREAKGVTVEQTYRCRTCEFETGCEWREAKTKALEQSSSKSTL